MTRAAIAAVLILGAAATARAQTAAVEVSQNAGASSEAVAGASTQVRLFGEARPNLRFKFEGAWGVRGQRAADDYGSDVFGTAYPYGNALDVIEAYGEYFVPGGGVVQLVKAGRYRTPFGISSASDHAYVGFLRPPLMRYGTYYGLSNGYLEHGVDVVAGAPRLSGEISVGRSADVGEAARRPGWNTVARVQAVIGAAVIGVSGLDTTPYLPAEFAFGRARFAGVDGRWMRGGVQLRGEWMSGRPFDGTKTRGGYLDVFVHRPSLGPVTIVARLDRLDYEAGPPYAFHTRRYTAGARVRVVTGLAISAGITHQGRDLTQRRRTVFDLGVSYTLRRDF